MKFKIDENLPSEIRDDLVAAGHDADTVIDEGLTGAPDPKLIEVVVQEKQILLTMDKGIADIRSYPPQRFSGIVLLRPAAQGRGVVLAFTRRHLPTILQMNLEGRLVVISESGLRIR